MIAMGKETTLAEVIQVEVQEEKKKKRKTVLEGEEEAKQKPPLLAKEFKNEQYQAPKLAHHQPQANSYTESKKKTKSTHIMLVHRDAETN